MVFISEEDFIKESNIEIIKKLMECNNGYITTKQLENLGISRNYLSIMKQKDIIEKVAKLLDEAIKLKSHFVTFKQQEEMLIAMKQKNEIGQEVIDTFKLMKQQTIKQTKTL